MMNNKKCCQNCIYLQWGEETYEYGAYCLIVDDLPFEEKKPDERLSKYVCDKWKERNITSLSVDEVNFRKCDN